jgi:hypothetical protein
MIIAILLTNDHELRATDRVYFKPFLPGGFENVYGI